MPTIKKSVRYIGTQNDYTNISNFFAQCIWPLNVNTVFIRNGWHSSYESRMGPGNKMVLAKVTYCGYCVNVDGSQKFHYYQN